jgi:tripartite-type tricarboxylate transporter receptor subunit TctC
MDEELVNQINASLKDIVMEDSAYVKGMLDMGQVPEWYSVEESKAILEDELETMIQVAKSLGIDNIAD